MKQPVGPVYAITPWNLPLAMGTRKLGPALAAGCTVVLKPAEQTPLTSLALAALLMEPGLPPGVLNVVPTSQAETVSTPIIRDSRLRKLTFTGSTGVGRRLIEQSAQHALKVSVELGGNAPFLVFEDADLDAAVEWVHAKMRFTGQACPAANRFLVHESVAAEFSHRLADCRGAMTVGRGTEASVEVGPLVDRRAIAEVSHLVDDATDKGARILTDGKVPDGPGYFYPPTVLSDVPTTAEIFRTEVFGPVAPISTFATEAEAVTLANDSEYGLASYLFTRDFSRTLAVPSDSNAEWWGSTRASCRTPLHHSVELRRRAWVVRAGRKVSRSSSRQNTWGCGSGPSSVLRPRRHLTAQYSYAVGMRANK